ncbi:hypothetical protein [Candidatus Binatus sp.]|uniref:hypothetical protein n=1 Tax=Candidatus Binatus sp. TaxID=2811406 RepID=UPI003CC6D620
MGFTKLADRLNIPAGQTGHVPPVLAGPMLRKVTPQSVTVWLAMRTSGTVTLTVQTTAGAFVMDGNGKSVAVGTNLHIVIVTAQSNAGAVMTESLVYQYDLAFDFDDADFGSMKFDAATDNASLAYKPYNLPTFCLPPQDPGSLRLICGSCRKASGDGEDNLALLDSLISQAALSTSPLVRPHQLLLMGDQIYADDVAEGLLTMLTDAASTLLGWDENLPGTKPFKAADRPAYTRWKTLDDVGFTSEDLRNHLMSLGEYLSAYLFVWSDVLWPKAGDPLPSYDEIKDNVLAAQSNFSPSEFATVLEHLLGASKGIGDANDSLAVLRKRLPDVRKALANIPTYMICDDHEVTDDWNMTRDFCKGVYGHDIGVRIVQNALVAYALCQHWGNTPEQFEPASSPGAGADLLKLLDQGDSASYDTNSPSIRSLVNVHTYDEIMKQTPNPACYHDPVSLDFHYTIEGPGHQVIVTDTRTWRTYTHGGGGAPDLLPAAQFQAQILSTPSLRTSANVDRVLLVVLTTNAPPTEFLRAFTRHDWLANHKERHPDIYESWEMLTLPYDRLLKTLSSKLPAGNSVKHYGPVIILSGDVHSSFASRLVYEATTRFEDDPNNPEPATAVFVQLVASSFKKQTSDTVHIHKKGYAFNPTHIWTISHVQEGYIGWNLPAGSAPLVVGSRVVPTGRQFTSGNGPVRVGSDSPTIVFTKEVPESPPGFVLQKTPDYRYRLEYLPQSSKAASTSNLAPVNIPPLSGVTPADRAMVINTYKTAMDHLVTYHGDGAGGGDIVGLNNLCEVSFEWGAGDEKYVTQKVRWWYKSASTLLQAEYRIKLDPHDFPDITPAVTPQP